MWAREMKSEQSHCTAPVGIFSEWNSPLRKLEKLQNAKIAYELVPRSEPEGGEVRTLLVKESDRRAALEAMYPYGVLFEEVSDSDFYRSACPWCGSNLVRFDKRQWRIDIMKRMLIGLFLAKFNRPNRIWRCQECRSEWQSYLRLRL